MATDRADVRLQEPHTHCERHLGDEYGGSALQTSDGREIRNRVNRRLAAVRLLAALLLAVTGAVVSWRGATVTVAQEPPPAQPIFRGGVNVVTVDVIVTDNAGNPIGNLTREDFEIIEDGAPQQIDQFRIVELNAAGDRDDRPRRAIRNRDDEELEASHPDVRIFALFLADYQVCWERQLAVRETLSRFVRTELRPDDLVAVVDPLLPVGTVLFTYDHESAARTIERFEGRKGDYTPRNDMETEHWRAASQSGRFGVIEQIRHAIVRDALKALAVRLGSAREGRKSIVFVSEGFPAAFATDSRQLREITEEANRHNTSMYVLDPRGLALSGFRGAGGGGRPGCPGSGSRAVQDTLRYLAEETDGRAIVDSNRFAEGLAQMMRDSSAYYLLGYTPTQSHTDGRFHEIGVRVKQRGVVVRARKGYWALSAADAALAAASAPSLPRPVLQALESLAPVSRDARLVRTWVGTARAANGTTRVTVVWEPTAPTSALGDRPVRVSLLAADARGAVLYRSPPSDPAAAAPRRFEFDSDHGPVEIRLTIEDGGGRVLDRELRSVELPSGSGAGAAMSTPRVFRARTARDVRVLGADAEALPVAAREFSRTERLLIRVDVYDDGTPMARLLDRRGEPLRDLVVTRAAAGGTHLIELPLNSLPAGEYLVEMRVNDSASVAELVAFRVVP